MTNKKAQGLNLLTAFIIGSIIFVIGLVIVINSGLISSSQSFMCPTITRFGTRTRGLLIDSADNFEVTIDTMIEDLASKSWYIPLLGLASTGGSIPILMAVEDFTSSIKDIGLISCTNPELTAGKSDEVCGIDSGIAKENFQELVAKMTLKCEDMYAAGEYDPLLRLTPPNPRTCFVINFNLKEPTSFYEIKDYMDDNDFDLGWRMGDILIENGYEMSDIESKTTFKQGVLFIKYGDSGAGGWRSQDCSISGAPSSVGDYDHVFWCLEEDETYDDNCKKPLVWDGN